jgi:hypothetical protein
MYEEEDDDLPMQYQRLTAHLQTSSADFNRRLSEYLTTQVAMRSALANSYSQQYNNARGFPNPSMSMFPSPMLAHQQQQQMPPALQRPISPSMFRQAPYPAPRPPPQLYQPSPHHRAASMATLQSLSEMSQKDSPGLPSPDIRRSSAPAPAPAPAGPPVTIAPDQISAAPPLSSSTSLSSSNASTPRRKPSFPQGTFSQFTPQATPPSQPQSQAQYYPPLNPYSLPSAAQPFANNPCYTPFSTALPLESQMFLSSKLDPADPLTPLFMPDSDAIPALPCDFTITLPPGGGAPLGKPDLDAAAAAAAAAPLESEDEPDDEDVNGETWNSFIDTENWDLNPPSQ